MQPIRTWAGVDVSAGKLVSRRWCAGGEDEREFDNDLVGHRQMVKWVGKGGRVCVEATGVYHLQLCLALVGAGVEVMVVNPRAAKDFARALQNRSKTDRVDAAALLEYVRRMEFTAWQPPREAVLELRELGRRLTQLIQLGTSEKNRLHAENAAGLSRLVVADIKEHIRQIERRVAAIQKAAVKVISGDEALDEQFRLLVGGRGIGPRSAILLLTELAVLDATMTIKQLVAHCGLDPREYESGTSVHRPARISKMGNARVRAILFMVALSAVRHDRGARTFYARLLVRGKKPKQAIVAVMRKYLHGIWIVMQRRVLFDSSVLFAASLAQAEPSGSAVAATEPEPHQDHPTGRSGAEELREQLEPNAVQATSSRKRRKAA